MKSTETLKGRISKYFQRHAGEWICGGTIQTLAAAKNYEPQNAGRRLREMVNDGDLKVEYRKGVNGAKVAWYTLNPKKHPKITYYVPELDKQISLFK